MHQRKIHLVNWNTLYKLKSARGLGFKNLHSMNEAFLLKLGWGVIGKPIELWVQVLKGKYDRGTIPTLQCKVSAYDSRLWKAICSLWPHLQSNIMHCLGNGERIEFWNHTWLDDGNPLLDSALSSVNGSDSSATVGDFVCEDGE